MRSCSGREKRGGGVPAPGDGRSGQESGPCPRHRSITPAALTYTSRATPSLAMPFSRGLEAFGSPPARVGCGGAVPCRAVCRRQRRGEARAAGPGLGLAGRERAAITRCIVAVGLPARCSIRETKRKSRLGSAGLQEVIRGKETLALWGGGRLAGDGEQTKGGKTPLIPAAANSFWLQPGVAGPGS